MKQALSIVALVTLTFALLLTAGVVNEDYLFLFGGLVGTPNDVAAENLHQALDAWNKSDWRQLGKIGTPYLHAFLWMYVLRSLVYLAAIVLTLTWLRPYVTKLFASFRQIESTLEQGLETKNLEDRKATIVKALRARSAQKRVEAYASLGTALLCLLVAIGFVTREVGTERPESLEQSATSINEAMEHAEQAQEAAVQTLSERLDALRTHEEELVALVHEELQRDSAERPTDIARVNQTLVSSLLARQAEIQLVQTAKPPPLASEYLVLAKAQLDLVNRQAELEVIQRTVLVTVTKVAAVALILALAQVLIRMYLRALDLSVQYDGTADAVLLSNHDITENLPDLRAVLTPVVEPDKLIKLPKSVLQAIEAAITKGKPTGV